jgi:hypothetical protein
LKKGEGNASDRALDGRSPLRERLVDQWQSTIAVEAGAVTTVLALRDAAQQGKVVSFPLIQSPNQVIHSLLGMLHGSRILVVLFVLRSLVLPQIANIEADPPE